MDRRRPLSPVSRQAQRSSACGNLRRVVQAAGRLIRRSDDRAALCLIDTRYQTRPYRDLLPVHWQLNTTPSPRLATLLDDFWNKG